MGTSVGAGFFIDMLLDSPLSAAERSKLFLCILSDASDRPLLVCLCNTDCALLGPLGTRFVEDRNLGMSPEYSDRSVIERLRSSSANTSYNA